MARARPIVVFNKMAYRKIGDFIIRVRAIIQYITDYPELFADISPSVEVINDNMNSLMEKEVIAKTRELGSVASRDIQYNIVLENLNNWLSYIQIKADNAINYESALEIIGKSGFSVKGYGSRSKANLDVRNTAKHGTVILTAKAVNKRAAYIWFISNDNVNWTFVDATLQAKVIIRNLISGSKMYFKFKAVLKDGLGPESQVFEIIIT